MHFKEAGHFYRTFMIPWLDNLRKVYGINMLVTLFCAQHVLKGFVMSYATTAVDFLFRAYSVQGPELQLYKAIINLPWAAKPVFGVLSDMCPILGYRKAPYLIGATMLGAVGYGIVGMSGNTLSLELVILGLLCGQVQISVCDLLTEAQYSEAMRNDYYYGPDLVTYVWAGVTIGGLAAVGSVGFVLESFGYTTVYFICFICAGTMLVPLATGHMNEQRLTQDEVSQKRADILKNQPEILVLALIMACCVFSLVFVGVFYANVQLNFAMACIVAVVVLSSFTLLLRPSIGFMNAYAFVQTCLALSVDGATFYFYIDDSTQYPEGPHFSTVFYTTVIGSVAGLFNLFGLWSYNRFMKDWKYRWLYFFANVAVCCISAMSIIVYSRANVRFGIPDKVFVLSGAVMNSVITTWMWIPGVVLLAQLCPKGMEAAMYALLAGCHNIGNSVSQYAGAMLLSLLGITPSGAAGESAKFENLWIAVMISAMLPLLSLVLLPRCIPDKRQTEPVLTEFPDSAVVDSPWQKLRARWGYTAILSSPSEQVESETQRLKDNVDKPTLDSMPTLEQIGHSTSTLSFQSAMTGGGALGNAANAGSDDHVRPTSQTTPVASRATAFSLNPNPRMNA